VSRAGGREGFGSEKSERIARRVSWGGLEGKECLTQGKVGFAGKKR